MSGASSYTQNNVLNALLRGVPFPNPNGTYLALHTADPGDVGSNEVVVSNWPSYARRSAEVGGAIGSGWTPAAAGTNTNTKQILFPAHDGVSQVTVTYYSVWDAAAGGNMLFSAPLNVARSLVPGDVFVFDVGSLTNQML